MRNLIETLNLHVDISGFLVNLGLEEPASYAIKVDQTKKYNQVNVDRQEKNEESFVEFDDNESDVTHY